LAWASAEIIGFAVSAELGREPDEGRRVELLGAHSGVEAEPLERGERLVARAGAGECE
jgi:hypothetical protein